MQTFLSETQHQPDLSEFGNTLSEFFLEKVFDVKSKVQEKKRSVSWMLWLAGLFSL